MRVAENKWFWRRTAVISVVSFCMAAMAFILVSDSSSVLHQGAFTTLAFILVSTVFSYMGWATADDAWVIQKMGAAAFGQDPPKTKLTATPIVDKSFDPQAPFRPDPPDDWDSRDSPLPPLGFAT